MAKKEGGLDWDGLLKWSLANSDGNTSSTARSTSEEDRKWFMEAVQSQTINVIQRMKEITLVMKTPQEVLESEGVTSENILDMLDELQDHVESIDYANDLGSIGGLVPLIGYLKNEDGEIRAKAADVVTTIVQNNPKSQQLVMEVNGFESLFGNFEKDSSVVSRTKALGAISSLIRGNKLGLDAFRLANGYKGLKEALGSDDLRFQRKALNLIQYLLQENGSDCDIVKELGINRQMVHLCSSTDSDVREAALNGLLELSRNNKLSEQEDLKKALEKRIDGILSMTKEELEAAKEERQLVDALWKECYNEPSVLREKGLLVLPGEESFIQPPDVAGKFFEPPLRAGNKKEESKKDGDDGKKDVKLLGPGPSA